MGPVLTGRPRTTTVRGHQDARGGRRGPRRCHPCHVGCHGRGRPREPTHHLAMWPFGPHRGRPHRPGPEPVPTAAGVHGHGQHPAARGAMAARVDVFCSYAAAPRVAESAIPVHPPAAVRMAGLMATCPVDGPGCRPHRRPSYGRGPRAVPIDPYSAGVSRLLPIP